MEPAQSKSGQDNQNSQKPFCRQPITCPWDTNQPYPSTLNKNRACDPTGAKTMLNIPFTVEPRSINEKTCPSLQHSSSQFFYFLRLMQLFPETHPATLHTVLSLCKNDFFCAVDKLLYAKRCKALYSRSQGVFKRCAMNRTHPYCSYGRIGNQQDKARGNETVVNFDVKEVGDGQRTPREKATQETSGELDGLPLKQPHGCGQLG
ncbi:hypothetical protein NQ315_008633 [Exocentrus adspersus]|uniref:Uncharacterized protein n=1 Tax=Exocentrus adspersus TaxID=1586481 RepID=A0AAV8W7I8_9CUCU|nr:hypothetical protein NQ315_008633 [Exocentrus adspersus]